MKKQNLQVDYGGNMIHNDLIKEFAKITNDKKDEKKTTAYGKVVKIDNKDYIKLDGSELLTPVETTVSLKQDNRVMVTIDNHKATVTGNITDPAASSNETKELGNKIQEFQVIIANKISVQQLEAEIGRINKLFTDELKATNATVESIKAKTAEIDTIKADNIQVKKDITANNAKVNSVESNLATFKNTTSENLNSINANIHNLNSDYGSFKQLTTNQLTTQNAKIGELDTKKLDTQTANAKYANIDFANINIAAVKKLFTDSGIIKDLVIQDGHITGKLVGVTIKGDIIEGGTIKADKLVVQGQDGLYYKLNVNGEKVEANQTQYNSLNGSIITAKSITAEKVNVSDLVAFGANIGGFKITNSAIHSVNKDNVNNTTRGIYLGQNGDFAVGDSNNYMKYFYDETSKKYKLVINADSIVMGGSTKTIKEIIDEKVVYTAELRSSQGNILKKDQSTILSAMVYRDGKLVPTNSVGTIKWFRSGVLMSDTTPNITIQANSFQELVNYSFEIWNSKNEKVCSAIEFLYKNKNIKDNRIMYKTVNKGATKPSAPDKYPDSNWTDVLPNDAFTPNKDCYKCILSLLEDGAVKVSYLEKMSNPTDLNIGGRNLFKYGKGDKQVGMFSHRLCKVDENGELYFDMKCGKLANGSFLAFAIVNFSDDVFIPNGINDYNASNYILSFDAMIKVCEDDTYQKFTEHTIGEFYFMRRFQIPEYKYVWDYTNKEMIFNTNSAEQNQPMILPKNELKPRTTNNKEMVVGDYVNFKAKNGEYYARVIEITDTEVKVFYEMTWVSLFNYNFRTEMLHKNIFNEYIKCNVSFNPYKTFNKSMQYPKSNIDKWVVGNQITFGGFNNTEANNKEQTRHIHLYLKNIKIEEGDVATNWTPSLEETQEELDNKATNQDIINVNNTITNTNTSLNNLESKVNDEINQNSVKFKEIETKVKTEIDSTKGSITDLITKTDGNKANLLELTKTVTSINNTIRQIGGDNLIQNSNMYAYDENTLLPSIWETSSAIDTTKKHSITYNNDSNSLNHGCISGRSFDVRNMSVKQKILVTKDNSEIVNKIYYSFSCKIKKPNTVKTTVKLYNFNDTLIKEYPVGTSVNYETVSFEKLLPNDSYYYIEFISEGSDTEGTIVTDCVFNIGEYTIPWQLSTGEILNSNLTINQEGITIRSNIYDGDYTIMSPIEFAGYSNNNNNKEKIFSLNKDITLVRKLHSQDEIQLPPIKMVPILTGNNKGVAFVKLD